MKYNGRSTNLKLNINQTNLSNLYLSSTKGKNLAMEEINQTMLTISLK